jgi:type IV secretion system protein VirB1
MMLLTAAATAFLLACSPAVATQTMAGLIQRESSWSEYAIGDNTARRSYFPTNYYEAVSIVVRLRAEGHSLDVGLAQINSEANWASYGLTPYNVFDPCRNVSVGASILSNNYRDALRIYAPGDDALAHALSAYNSGQFTASMGYAAGVMDNARSVRFLSDPHATYAPPPTARVKQTVPAGNIRSLPIHTVAAAAEARRSVLQWATPSALPVRTAPLQSEDSP